MMEKVLSGMCPGLKILHFQWEGSCVVPSRRVSWGRNVQAAESRRAASLWGGASAGCTGGLDGKVLQLWKEVNRHGMLIISRLVDAMEGSVEEVGNWEQGKE